MGTRHLTLLYYTAKIAAAKAQTKAGASRQPLLAQYGQCDGYPEAQGLNLIRWLKDPANITKLKESLDKDIIYTPEQAELENINREVRMSNQRHRNLEQGTGNWTAEQVEELEREDPSAHSRVRRPESSLVHIAPSLSKETSWKILPLIADAKTPVPVILATDFLSDNVFCEWAYTIDLDQNVFEVYGVDRIDNIRLQGYQGDAVPVRFRSLETVKESGSGVRLIKSYPLDNLPEESQLLADCTLIEEEQEDEF